MGRHYAINDFFRHMRTMHVWRNGNESDVESHKEERT
jgi:hypothetical protein